VLPLGVEQADARGVSLPPGIGEVGSDTGEVFGRIVRAAGGERRIDLLLLVDDRGIDVDRAGTVGRVARKTEAWSSDRLSLVAKCGAAGSGRSSLVCVKPPCAMPASGIGCSPPP
jgi:hypothetical protein